MPAFGTRVSAPLRPALESRCEQDARAARFRTSGSGFRGVLFFPLRDYASVSSLAESNAPQWRSVAVAMTKMALRICPIVMAAGLTACGGRISSPDAGTTEAGTFIGRACRSDTACSGDRGEAGFGEGPLCAKSHFGVPLPGGYCTVHCASPADCPGTPNPGGALNPTICGVARYDVFDGGGVANACFRACDPSGPNTCRAGYTCLPIELAAASKGTIGFGCWTQP